MGRLLVCATLVLFLAPPVHAAAPYFEENWILCGSLLMKHVDAPVVDTEPWFKLPEYLADIGSGTLLVKFDLPEGEDGQHLPNALAKPLRGLQIPEALKMIHGRHFVMVINGKRGPLQRFYQRVQDLQISSTGGFQFLDFTRAQTASSYPAFVIQLDANAPDNVRDRVEHEIGIAMNDGLDFAVFYMQTNQMAFFTPRNALLPRISSDFWAAEKIDTSIEEEVPAKWTDWLLRRAEELNHRRAILAGDWAVLSPIAYGKSIELARMANSKQPSIDAVDSALRAALHNCFTLACEVEPRIVTDLPPIQRN
jgi:hypothetical protein